MSENTQVLEAVKELNIPIEGMTFHYIDENAVVKTIKWGRGFEKKTTEEQLEYLKVLASSLNQQNYIAYEERNAGWEYVDVLKKQIEQADIAAERSKKLYTDAITKSNDLSHQLAQSKQEITKLKKEIESLKVEE